MHKAYLKTDEAARYLDLSESYLVKLRRASNDSDGPPFVRLGRRAIRYRKVDLDAWAECHLRQIE